MVNWCKHMKITKKKLRPLKESEESVAEIDPETLEDTLPLLIEKRQIQRNQPALLLHMCCTDHVPGQRPMAIAALFGKGGSSGAALCHRPNGQTAKDQQPRCPTASKKVQICRCSNSEMSWAMCCGMVSMKGAGSCDC